MAANADIANSLQNIHGELQRLRNAGVLHPGQFKSINAQLPHPNGTPSAYHDPNYGAGHRQQQQQGHQGDEKYSHQQQQEHHEQMVSQIAQQSQDPNHPAHPAHKEHANWVKSFGSKLGNAAVFGAGATAGSQLVNHLI